MAWSPHMALYSAPREADRDEDGGEASPAHTDIHDPLSQRSQAAARCFYRESAATTAHIRRGFGPRAGAGTLLPFPRKEVWTLRSVWQGASVGNQIRD